MHRVAVRAQPRQPGGHLRSCTRSTPPISRRAAARASITTGASRRVTGRLPTFGDLPLWSRRAARRPVPPSRSGSRTSPERECRRRGGTPRPARARRAAARCAAGCRAVAACGRVGRARVARRREPRAVGLGRGRARSSLVAGVAASAALPPPAVARPGRDRRTGRPRRSARARVAATARPTTSTSMSISTSVRSVIRIEPIPSRSASQRSPLRRGTPVLGAGGACGAGPRSRRPPPPRTASANKAHGGHLPVPVEAGVEGPGRKAGRRPAAAPGRADRAAPGPPRPPPRNTSRNANPTMPSSAARLEVEGVGVARGVHAIAFLEPFDEEAAGPEARCTGWSAPRLEGDIPIAVAVRVDRAEPRRIGAGRRRRALGLALERRDDDDGATRTASTSPRGPPSGRETGSYGQAQIRRRGARKRRSRRRRARGAPGPPSIRAPRPCPPCSPGSSDVTVGRRVATTRPRRQRPRRPPTMLRSCGRCGGREREQHEHADARPTRARRAAKRQVDAEPERHSGRGGRGAQTRRTVRIARDPHRQHHPHSREDAERVPVRERLLQPARRRDAAVELDQLGQQPLRERVADHHQGAQSHRRLQPAPRTRRRAAARSRHTKKPR